MRGEGSMKNRMQDLDFEQTVAFEIGRAHV